MWGDPELVFLPGKGIRTPSREAVAGLLAGADCVLQVPAYRSFPEPPPYRQSRRNNAIFKPARGAKGARCGFPGAV
jgi:hypothetical protein